MSDSDSSNDEIIKLKVTTNDDPATEVSFYLTRTTEFEINLSFLFIKNKFYKTEFVHFCMKFEKLMKRYCELYDLDYRSQSLRFYSGKLGYQSKNNLNLYPNLKIRPFQTPLDFHLQEGDHITVSLDSPYYINYNKINPKKEKLEIDLTVNEERARIAQIDLTEERVKERENADEHRCKIRFHHEKYPEDSFEIMHPTLVTNSSDCVILPKNLDPENKKQFLIPAHKDLMTLIPYFKAQMNENSKWRELKDKDIIEVAVPLEVSPIAVFDYVKSVYDKNFNPFEKDSCVDILKLSLFWCDDFMEKRVKKFISENLTKDICKVILKDHEISQHFDDLFEEVVECAFSSRNKVGQKRKSPIHL